ncbi:MAG: DUF1015 domain-containing protein [Candidatus Omnitrophica bacterium]|nr:DUF1015 domain-containing protein [Candidatus Omnitrophota bacterium]
MAYTIKAFRATHYNPRLIKNFSTVTCPPYDVINKKQEFLLKNKSPYNFCNILLTDNGNYKALGQKFRQWVSKKILFADTKESLYLYEQKFTIHGKRYVRFGVLGLLRMDGKKAIFPHEYTLKAPKIDRKKIISEVKANLSPVFVIASRPSKILKITYRHYSKTRPFLKFKDTDGNPSRVWKIENSSWIKKLCEEFDKHKLVIADGHHRFEVSYNYYKKHKKEFAELNYILAYITDAQSGLVILPTHRVVSVKNEADIFGPKVSEYFYINKTSEKELEKKLMQSKEFSFGVYRNKQFYFLRLKNRLILDKIFKGSVYKNLDTYILHKFVFTLCNIEGQPEYTHELSEAKKLAGSDKAAFILKPTPLAAVFKIANQGYRLPQKSTYFYPKVSSGIVLRKFEKRR